MLQQTPLCILLHIAATQQFMTNILHIKSSTNIINKLDRLKIT
ncbi:hypothetical protein GXM_01404 [Nostoc sphaeroides CCNUC1]|uniref:Uncharacterized protein n=1 Tax=Nostoc sphaeroides CCNUC1 TaxID=2653204 RepID=A0A5P8VUD4_9NOSO|nr:hypothetical protein GXM_01404 [Nostoc sphaeroides CCNUC1]